MCSHQSSCCEFPPYPSACVSLNWEHWFVIGSATMFLPPRISCNYHMLFWKERLLVGYLSELWKNNPSALCPRLEEVQILGGCSYFTLKSACFSQFHWEVRVNHSSRSSSTLLLNINIIKTLSKSSSKTPHVVKAFLFYPVFITVVCEIFALIIYGSPPCMSRKAQSTWRKDFASVATQPWDQHVLRWWQAAVTS